MYSPWWICLLLYKNCRLAYMLVQKTLDIVPNIFVLYCIIFPPNGSPFKYCIATGMYWGARLENVPSDMRSKKTQPACASTQPNHCLICPHEKTLHPSLSEMYIMMELRKCPAELNYCWAHMSEGCGSIKVYLTKIDFIIGFSSECRQLL